MKLNFVIIIAAFFAHGPSPTYALDLDQIREICRIKDKVEECGKLVRQYALTKPAPNDRSLAYFHLGLAQGRVENDKEAIRGYTKSLAWAERSSAYFNRSQHYRYTGKPDEALKDLRVAVKLNPDYAKAWLDISLIEGDKANYQTCVDAARKTVSSKQEVSAENLSKAFANIGFCSRRLDKLEDSETALIEALSVNSNNNVARRHLVRTYLRMGDLEKTEETLKAAFLQEPNNRFNRRLEKALVKLRTLGTPAEESDL